MCTWNLSLRPRHQRIRERREYFRGINKRRRDRAFDLLGRVCVVCGAEATQIAQPRGKARGYYRYYPLDCKPMCEDCVKRHRTQARREHIRHGTRTGYKLGCRCLACTRAKADERRLWLSRKNRPGGVPFLSLPHGNCCPRASTVDHARNRPARRNDYENNATQRSL